MLNFGTNYDDKADFHLFEIRTLTLYTEGGDKNCSKKRGHMKEQVQRLGRFLSGMVMPNINVFIVWGFITALFIKQDGYQ